MARPIERTDEEWREILTPEQYQVLRKQHTEAPFTGQYVHVSDSGVYRCAGCETELFRSDTKYDSHCGWPSFWDAIDPARIERRRDWSMVVPRTEIVCAACGGHLGHVFNDGPQPTGERYCVNSAALAFKKGAGDGAETETPAAETPAAGTADA